MGVLTALATLAGLIVVHDAGHFFAATWQRGRQHRVDWLWARAARLQAPRGAACPAGHPPYHRIDLCTGDMDFFAAGAYCEISSCSMSNDFQASRSVIRFKEGKSTQLMNTLNSSACKQVDGPVRLGTQLMLRHNQASTDY